MPTKFCPNCHLALRPCSLTPLAALASDGEDASSYLYICEIEERFTGTPVTLLLNISNTPSQELLNPIIAFEKSSRPDESTREMKVCFHHVNSLKEKEFAPLAAFVLSAKEAITEAIYNQSTGKITPTKEVVQSASDYAMRRYYRGIGFLQTLYERGRLSFATHR